MQVRSLGQEGPWRRKWQPTPVFLPGEPQGQKSLVGYRCKEVDTTEQTERNSEQNCLLSVNSFCYYY